MGIEGTFNFEFIGNFIHQCFDSFTLRYSGSLATRKTSSQSILTAPAKPTIANSRAHARAA